MCMKSSAIVAFGCAAWIMLVASGCGIGKEPFALSASGSIASAAAPSKALEQLSIRSDALYSAANASNRQEAYRLLQQIESIAAEKTVRGSGTKQGWQAFDASLNTAKQAMGQKGTTLRWYTETARLKLASDALFRPDMPLWLQYEGILRDDSQRIRMSWQSMTEDRGMAAEASIGVYAEHVDRMEVAALMQRSQAEIDAIEERIQYIKNTVRAAETGQIRPDAVITALDSLDATASELFKGSGEDKGQTTMAPAVPPGMTVGGQREGAMQVAEMLIAAFVMGVLGYAGWRKYRGQQDEGIPFSRK